jgi:sensor histidine kinase YesM
MLLSLSGIFLLLVISALYILFSGRQLQGIVEESFARERFIKSVQTELDGIHTRLSVYLSEDSPDTPVEIRSAIRELQKTLPPSLYGPDRGNLREKEIFSLIASWLSLADRALEEKQRGNIVYTETFGELRQLLAYINGELDLIYVERFHSQMELFENLITLSGTLQLRNTLFVISVSLFAVLLLLRSVEHVTAPLVRLSGMAAELSEGRFDSKDIETGSIQEINQVVEAFNHMKNEIRNYVEAIQKQHSIKQEILHEKMRNLKMETLIRHMEIYTLQAQMNPHFLFNTLNTGMQLAIVEGADRTCEFMESMAKFFRHATRNKDIVVPLSYEIEGLGYYFDILRVRFYRNIDLIMDYDKSLPGSIRVPVSLIQPLVENCVVHAFKAREALLAGLPKGFPVRRPRVAVRIERQDRRLLISVEDNGCGMPRETRDRLLRPLSTDELSLSRVMGLSSIVQRLYFLYPDDPSVIDIDSEEGNGTNILIRIDMEREPCIVSL